VAAAAADRVFGDPRRFHPVAGFGRAAAALERVLWRNSRAAGAVYAASLVGGVYAAARVADRHWLTRTATVWATLGGRSLERAASVVATAVAEGDLHRARALAPALVGRDPDVLDAAGLVRAAVESLAENTSDAVVAPLVWTTILGAPGAAAYRAVNTLDAMVGRRNARYARFGWAAARADDLASWPGASLTVVLTGLASGKPRAAWTAALRDGPRHPSPNAGRVEAAFAGALGLRLGGRTAYPHAIEERPVLGHGHPPRPEDVARAVRLCRLVTAGAVALAAIGARR
jgi:adenosylcobinamide-phosphate synthase